MLKISTSERSMTHGIISMAIRGPMYLKISFNYVMLEFELLDWLKKPIKMLILTSWVLAGFELYPSGPLNGR